MDFKNTLTLNGTDVLTATTGYTRTHLSTSGQSSVHWGNLTITPTTLAGYGISDAAPLTHTTNTSNPHSVTAAQVGAPTTTGTGASGTWPISVTGRATYLNTTYVSDMNSIVPAGVYQAYSPANQPTPAHWHWLQMPYLETSEGWAAQIAVSFYADALWFRRQSGATWQPWCQVLHAGNVGTYALALSTYYQASTWIQFNTANGLYWPGQCGTHIYPSATTYGAFTMTGSKDGWAGVSFNSPENGVITLMCSISGGTSGMHNQTYGWQIRWAVGTLYVGKGTYGGSEVAVLDASNYSSYALPLTGGATTGPVGIRVGAWTSAGLQVRGPGTTASTYGLIVTNSAGTNGFWINDAGTAYVRNSPVTFSDARLKAAIEPLTGALAIVCAIPARQWRWKDDLNGLTRYGPIAQETELVAPELVVEGSPGPGEKLIPGERPLLSLRGDSLLGLVHGAIHELAARVAALETA